MLALDLGEAIIIADAPAIVTVRNWQLSNELDIL